MLDLCWSLETPVMIGDNMDETGVTETRVCRRCPVTSCPSIELVRFFRKTADFDLG